MLGRVILRWLFLFLPAFVVLFSAGFFDSKSFTASLNQLDILEKQNTPIFDALLSLDPPATEEGKVVLADEEKQNLIDDLKEKIDLINRQISDLLEEQNQLEYEEMKEEEKEDEEDEKEQEQEQEQEQDKNKQAVTYPEILISETLASPISQRFIKLFNPNDFSVSLTGWYFQRKTQNADSWSSCVSSTNFENKTIYAHSYFLIARENFNANILLPDLILSESNSLVLKNPNGEISATALTANVTSTGGGSGGGSNSPAPVVYPKILISEIQISPIGKRFIELYNPTDKQVSLTGWYLQRKTKSASMDDLWSSCVSSPNFAGKIIGSNDYFMISRDSYYVGSNDIFTILSITPDNSFAFKNPNREISDKVGFGLAQDFETASFLTNPEDGQSIGRVFDGESQTYKDTDDNSVDFKLSTPTPGKENEILTQN